MNFFKSFKFHASAVSLFDVSFELDFQEVQIHNELFVKGKIFLNIPHNNICFLYYFSVIWNSFLIKLLYPKTVKQDLHIHIIFITMANELIHKKNKIVGAQNSLFTTSHLSAEFSRYSGTSHVSTCIMQMEDSLCVDSLTRGLLTAS